MVKLSWVVVCQRALNDQTGNVTLVQVVEEIGFPAPPKDAKVRGAPIPFPISIVTTWRRGPGDRAERAKARLRLIAPDGKQFGQAEFEVDVAGTPRARWMIEMSAIPYQGPGQYVFRVDLASGKRWRNVGEAEFVLHHNVPVEKSE